MRPKVQVCRSASHRLLSHRCAAVRATLCAPSIGKEVRAGRPVARQRWHILVWWRSLDHVSISMPKNSIALTGYLQDGRCFFERNQKLK